MTTLQTQLDRAIVAFWQDRCLEATMELGKLYARMGRTFGLALLGDLTREEVRALPREIMSTIKYSETHQINNFVTHVHDSTTYHFDWPHVGDSPPQELSMWQALRVAEKFEGEYLIPIWEGKQKAALKFGTPTFHQGGHIAGSGPTLTVTGPGWVSIHPKWLYFEPVHLGEIILQNWLGMEEG